MTRFKRIGVAISILLNVLFISDNIWSYFNDRVGILTQSVEVGHFGNGDVLFRLPKGLVVRDASPSGLGAIGQFEPYRFTIVVTTDRQDVVNYAVGRKSLPFGENMYSIDFRDQPVVK